MIHKQIRYFTLILLLTNCFGKKEAPKLFSHVPNKHTNIHFTNELKETAAFNILEYLYFYDGAGVAVGDINNDGLKDLFFTSNQASNKLYLNRGNLTFEDISESSGITGFGGWSIGVAMADVNGDGFLDIYVSQLGNYKGIYGENRLFVNDGGDGVTFTERAKEYGVYHSGYSTQASFFDYDNDGDLDMYLLNHSAHGPQNFGPYTLRYERDSLAGDRLFRNDLVDGIPRYVDVTKKAGIYSSFIGYGLGVTAADINLDGWMDIFISNDFHENDYLYINNGDGTFTDKLEQYMGHTSLASMGNDVADFNNDGLPDIMVLEMMPDKEDVLKKSVVEDPEVNDIVLKFGYIRQVARNTLHLNTGVGLFSEIALLAGVQATDWSWSPLLCDLDQDGLKDLFVSNGIYKRPNDVDAMNFKYQYLLSNLRNKSKQEVEEFLANKESLNTMFIEKMPTDPIANKVFKNNGDLTFTEKVEAWGLDDPVFSNGSAYADLDNDGDLDLVMNNINQEASIYRNNSEKVNSNNFLSIQFAGIGGNRFGIGAKVYLKLDKTVLYQEQMPVRGFQSSVDPVLNFGLGTAEIIDTVQVIWPNQKTQVLTDVAVNQVLTVNQEDALMDYHYHDQTNRSTIFSDITTEKGVNFIHRENEFNDFDVQFLMPHQLSTQGPKLATGDVNADDLEDFYIGGAKNQSGQLFLQQSNGTFAPSKNQAFERDSIYEDIESVLFDADNDLDLDLYVVSGGNEPGRSSEIFEDRLYINNGSGIFERAYHALPEDFSANGSCVATADIDHDGDLDLFVGSRSAVNNYGYDPSNYILRNDGNGTFENAGSEMAPDLPSGMITDAVFADIDNNDLPDLIAVGDWMPVMVFMNEEGQLRDRTAQAGFQKSSGWWNCIQAADMDGDGDKDLMAGNLGLNSKITASLDQPVSMYVRDFDANGKLDQILCTTINGRDMPFPMLDELIRQIPGIKSKLPTYREYAAIEGIHDIFSSSQLEDAIVKRAYNLRTSYYENLGDGTFELRDLPLEAQFSPVYSILPGDYDGDGRMDLLLGGNFNGASINYGYYDAMYGLLLTGDGKGTFTAVTPLTSGLQIIGEIRDMAKVSTPDRTIVLVGRNDDQLLFLGYGD